MRKIDIRLNRGDIVLELAKWSHTVGENIGDDMAKARHFVQGLRDEGHIDLIYAAVDDAWSEVLQILSAYTVGTDCECADCECVECKSDIWGNEDLVEGGELRVVLSFPDCTYPALGRNVASLSRRYIVQKCRAEWERLTRQDPIVSEREAEMCARRLRRETMLRTRPIKMKGWYGWR